MLQTVELMVATHGLALHRRNQQVIDSVRGVPERVGDHIGSSAGRATPVVADVVEFPFTAIELPGEPVICRLDAKDRFHLAGAGRLLGLAPGDDLATEGHGRWLLLRRAGTRTRTHVPRYGARDRITLPRSHRTPLGLGDRRHVLALALPAAGVLAVCDPALILRAAPVDLAAITRPEDHR